LQVIEFALGAGYEVIESLRVGAAFRVVRSTAELQDFGFAEPVAGVSSILATNMHDMEGTSTSFRAGVQYAPTDKPFGFGVMVNFPTKMKLEGKLSSMVQTNFTAAENLGEENATLKDELPLQVVAGSHFDFTDKYRMMLQYDYRNTKKKKEAQIIASVDISGTRTTLPNLTKNWKDSHLVRLGNEYKCDENLTLRGGLSYISNVVPKSHVSPVFSAPGAGYGLAVGGGYKFTDTFKLNSTLEYAIVSAEVKSNEFNTKAAPTRDGDYKTQAYGVVIGGEMQF
jgi:long-subunit fatty acid transport protein